MTISSDGFNCTVDVLTIIYRVNRASVSVCVCVFVCLRVSVVVYILAVL